MNVKERIKKFIQTENITIVEFEKSINASNGYVNSIHKSIGLDKLHNIIEKYPNLNIEWLFTCNGKMTKNEEFKVESLDNERLLRRFEEVVSENALLKSKIEKLEVTRGKSNDPPAYTISEKKIGSHITAEPTHTKHTR